MYCLSILIVDGYYETGKKDIEYEKKWTYNYTTTIYNGLHSICENRKWYSCVGGH